MGHTLGSGPKISRMVRFHKQSLNSWFHTAWFHTGSGSPSFSRTCMTSFAEMAFSHALRFPKLRTKENQTCRCIVQSLRPWKGLFQFESEWFSMIWKAFLKSCLLVLSKLKNRWTSCLKFIWCVKGSEYKVLKLPTKLEVATDSEESDEEEDEKAIEKDTKGPAQTQLTVKMVNKWSKSLAVSIM